MNNIKQPFDEIAPGKAAVSSYNPVPQQTSGRMIASIIQKFEEIFIAQHRFVLESEGAAVVQVGSKLCRLILAQNL